MNKVIEDGLRHFRAKAARYRNLAEKAENEVTRLESLAQLQAAQQSDKICEKCGASVWANAIEVKGKRICANCGAQK